MFFLYLFKTKLLILRILLIPFLLLVSIVSAQVVNIPDANFKQKLLTSSPDNDIAKDLNGNFIKIDANGDGEIQVSEALNVLSIEIYPAYGIYDVTGLEQFLNLEVFKFDLGNLTSIDVSQNTKLKILDVGRHFIDVVDVSQLPDLEILDVAMSTLINIDVTQNPLLKELYLKFTDLSVLGLDVSQNPNLEVLSAVRLQLSNLDLSNNPRLKYLNIKENYFTSIDLSQNPDLEVFYCIQNNITEIDFSNNPNLRDAYLNFNNLHTINVSQCPNLQILFCNNNNLSSVDLSNNVSLADVRLSFNDLTEINMKNGINDAIFFGFPYNPNLAYICADESEIIQLIEKLSFSIYAGMDPIINSYCQANTGDNRNTIRGTVYYDQNNNGCSDNSILSQNTMITIDDGTAQGATYTNTLGNYAFYTGIGSFDMTAAVENPQFFTITPDIATITFDNIYNNEIVQDFCVVPNGIHDDISVLIAPQIVAQPGFDATYEIIYKNNGNTVLSGNIELEFDDTVLDYISSTLPIDSQIADILTWSYTDLLPFESRSFIVTFNVNSPAEVPAVNIDDELGFSARIFPVVNDEHPNDNVFEMKQIVIGSYDPNDKICLEGVTVLPTKIGEYLHYVINFENTGTAPATFISIKDVINPNYYELSSMQIIKASHEMEVKLDGNEVEFFFDDINLGASEKGNVIFKIKTKPTLTLGDTVSNKAFIYFDYNLPIETNNAQTTFENPQESNVPNEDSSEEQNLILIQGDTRSIITVKAENIIKKINLFTIQGKFIKTIIVDSEEYSLDNSNLKSGVYFVEIETTIGTQLKKIVK